MNRDPDQPRDHAAGGGVPLRRRSFAELFFRTSIFEIIAYGMRGKGELIGQLEGLPPAGRELILRVVRRARLWKAERIDVAAELASHFREALAKGATEGELVRGFGNERTTARLIRRGMRRKRPLAWKLWFYWSRGLVTLVLSLVAVYLFLYGRALIDTPSIKRNYVAEWNAATSAIPAADRAAPLYAEANYAIANAPGAKEGLRFMVERDPSERGYVVSKEFLEANPQLVEMIRDATRKPRMGMVISDAEPNPEWNMAAKESVGSIQLRPASENPVLVSVLLPHLGAMRQMARMASQDAAIAVQGGDSARVIENWSAILRMSRHASEDGTLIGQLVGLAMLDMVFRDVAGVVQARPELFDASQLRGIAHAIAGASLRGRPGDFSVSFARESAMLDDVVQRVFTDDGKGDGRLAPRGMADLGDYLMPQWATDLTGVSRGNRGRIGVGPIAPLAVAWSAGRRETVDAYRELVGAFEAQRQVRLWERDVPSPLGAALQKYDAEERNSRYFVLQALWPSFWRMITAERGVVQTRDVALVSVALVAYRVGNGMWPSMLEELVPTYMHTVPVDGFDGKPLKYRLVDGKPLLYSIGLDLEDNQGTAALTEAAAQAVEVPTRMPSKTLGFDAVYWPRPVYPKPAPPLE